MYTHLSQNCSQFYGLTYITVANTLLAIMETLRPIPNTSYRQMDDTPVMFLRGSGRSEFLPSPDGVDVCPPGCLACCH